MSETLNSAPILTRARPEPVRASSRLRVLLASFSARFAVGQTIDAIYDGLHDKTDMPVMLPTNYSGTIPESAIFRVPCGISKAGGVAAGFNPLAHLRVLEGIRKIRPDVVYLYAGEGFPWALTLAAELKRRKIPMTLTLHDPDPHPGSMIEKMNAVIRKPVLASLHTVHLFSDRHVGRLSELLPRKPFTVIPHGSLAVPFLKARHPGVPRERLVLSFGRIQYYKGIDVLLRAMALLPPDVRVAIAGPGELSAVEKPLFDALGDRAELHNDYLDEAAVAKLMQRASVLALPYRHVTQSSVPGIGASFGLPLVASALGNFVDEIPELGGILVPPEDPQALADAIGQALARGVDPKPVPTFSDLAPDFLALFQSMLDPAAPGRREGSPS